MTAKELREQTDTEAVELACQLRARTLNYPNSEELHNAAVAAQAEVNRRLSDSQKENERACPCKYGTPCKEDCTCVKPYSSAGCENCCTYGSLEQRTAKAQSLTRLRQENERLNKQSIVDNINLGLEKNLTTILDGDVATLRRDLSEAYEWINKRWYVETEDGTKCFYCGEEVIDETEDYRPKHPTNVACIVLTAQKARESK